jgi:GTP-binding protein
VTVAAPGSEAGRRLFAGTCDFVAGAATEDALPRLNLPEVAFAGRSNVGKSSLINALTGRKALARVSHTPGRTQQINFFSIANRLMLVDLPGYGYAKASKQKIGQWSGLILHYLQGRPGLRRVMVLIDSRHGIKDSDRDLFELLDGTAVVYQIVMTKADEVPKTVGAMRDTIAAELVKRPAAHPEIAVTSSRDGLGMPELRAVMAGLAEAPPRR